jgi:hypothetical protein
MLDLLLKLIDRLIALAKKRSEINRELFNDFVQPAFQTFEIVHADYIESLTRYSARLADKTFGLNLDHPVFRDIELDSLKSEHLRTKLADFKPVESPPKLKPFLIAIDFYLRGLSVSGMRSELIDKVAGPELKSLRENDLEKGLGGRARFGNQGPKAAYHIIDSAKGVASFGVIFADPMREALREQLMGFDAPQDLSDDEEWASMCESLSSYQGMREEDRRRLCAQAVGRTIQHFQSSYRDVSHEYSTLRSELISPA